jgi:hypothetical protein
MKKGASGTEKIGLRRICIGLKDLTGYKGISAHGAES